MHAHLWRELVRIKRQAGALIIPCVRVHFFSLFFLLASPFHHHFHLPQTKYHHVCEQKTSPTEQLKTAAISEGEVYPLFLHVILRWTAVYVRTNRYS